MKDLNIVIPITKADESRHEIYGIMTAEEVDKSGECLDYEGAKPEIQKWSDEISRISKGKSKGNLRRQHNPNDVVGKVVDIVFNDDKKQVECCAKVTDERTFQDILQGIISGFSIGGSYLKTWVDENGVTKYIPRIIELSVVDSPCLGEATIQFIKADGTTEEKTFNKKEVSEVDKEKETQVEVEKSVDTEVKAEETVEKAESTETVEKATETEEIKEEKTVEKADEPKEESKEEAEEEQEEEKEVEKTAEVEKDVFEMCSKAMDNADDSVKEKCGKLFHKMVEKGLYCKCGKCAKAIEGEKAEKAAADNDLHKAVDNEGEAMQKFAPADELAKAMGVIDELKKGFDALKSDNEALKKQVEKLENEPVAGGAIMANGTMALDKTIGGSMGNAPANNGEADMLKKMIAETDSAVLKEAYSKQLAQLEMKKVFG